MLYLNTFDDFLAGILLIGANGSKMWMANGVPQGGSGLQFKCNQFSNSGKLLWNSRSILTARGDPSV